jgi:hypothetical protein
MKKTDFIIETYDQYLARVLDDLRKDRLVEAKISTMNLFASPNSLVHNFLSEMHRANRKNPANFLVYYDDVYTRRMLVMPDGHYIFPHSLWDVGKGRLKSLARQTRAENLREFADILVNLPPRFHQTAGKANLWRRLRSNHLLQHLAASHIKAGVTFYQNGRFETAIQTGELSSASDQNNLSLSIINNQSTAEFVKTIIDPKTTLTSSFAVKQIAPRLQLIADFGNYGQPGQLAKIHQLAEQMINPENGPRPTNVILISQYLPSGRILRALKFAANPKNFGARVLVPMEPADDYRRREIGFKILDKKFQLQRGKHILTPNRPRPSHTKCLIVAYDDGRLSMIFGSDNFDSTSDNFYRNSELSLFVDKVKKGQPGHDMIIAMLGKLVETKEISLSELSKII